MYKVNDINFINFIRQYYNDNNVSIFVENDYNNDKYFYRIYIKYESNTSFNFKLISKILYKKYIRQQKIKKLNIYD